MQPVYIIMLKILKYTNSKISRATSPLEALCDYVLYKSTFTSTLYDKNGYDMSEHATILNNNA